MCNFILGCLLHGRTRSNRCASSLPATPDCKTTTVTRWHSTVAQHIKSLDPNHLISSGWAPSYLGEPEQFTHILDSSHQGFFCVDCPKLFPLAPPPPPPQASPAPGTRRRRSPKPLTRARLLQERKAVWKKARTNKKRAGQLGDGVRVRGRWVASRKRVRDFGLWLYWSACTKLRDDKTMLA